MHGHSLKAMLKCVLDRCCLASSCLVAVNRIEFLEQCAVRANDAAIRNDMSVSFKVVKALMGWTPKPSSLSSRVMAHLLSVRTRGKLDGLNISQTYSVVR